MPESNIRAVFLLSDSFSDATADWSYGRNANESDNSTAATINGDCEAEAKR